MSNDKPLTRFNVVTQSDADEDGSYEYGTTAADPDGNYLSVDALRERLEKALADAPPDGSSDAYRTVLGWLGKP